MITVDYETHAIVGNPIVNPPTPVGVSIKYDDEPSRYYAWGHPSGNNCTEVEAVKALKKCWASSHELLFHNASFDLSIAAKFHGFKFRDPLRIYDTQFSIFLTDPYAASMALKPSAERILGLAPDEQDELKHWILSHVTGATEKNFGAYIALAPGDLVGCYACGDTDRTKALHDYLHKQILDNGMLEAYRREQHLMPILIESSRKGIRVDVERLGPDYEKYTDLAAKVDRWFFRRLGREFDMDKDAELADAMEALGMVKPEEWIKTPTGKRSVARKNLLQVIQDQEFLTKLNYRSALNTALGTFMGPWLEYARADGRVHTQWNQVRGDKSTRDLAGARTGRLSSMEPNFTNVMTESQWQPDGWPALPYMREYLLPEEGHVWLKRDFKAQEMRIAAHFAEGQLHDAFNKDPTTDPHDFVRQVVADLTGNDLPRKHIKETGFQILYGGGAQAITDKLRLATKEEGARLKQIYFGAMPEFKELAQDTQRRGRQGGFIRTWGGRIYYKEPDREIKGRMVDFSYKLLNYLIQGSAADQTKQSTIDWYKEKAPDTSMLALVHDEINISAPAEDYEVEMAVLRQHMNAPRFDVPFLSDGFVGPNWHDLEEME